jgi:hypothetical protein
MKELTHYNALMSFIDKETCFKVIGNKIGCVNCLKTFTYKPKEGTAPLKQHLKSSTHIKNAARNVNQCSLAISKVYSEEERQFDIDLLEAFTSANIPFSKLENETFKEFLNKYCKRSVKSESWYRKNLLEDVEFKKTEQNIIYFQNKPIYCVFDETTDIKGRYILNILIGECSKDKRMPPVLMRTVELVKTNAININQEEFFCCKKYLLARRSIKISNCC